MPSDATLAQRAVYPLAIPTVAGAGAMLTVVLLTDNYVRSLAEQASTTVRVALVLVVVFGVLALSKVLYGLFGRAGLELMSSRIWIDPGQHRHEQHHYRDQAELPNLLRPSVGT